MAGGLACGGSGVEVRRGMPNERGGTVKVLPPSRAGIAKIPRCWMKLSPEFCFFIANTSITKLSVSFFFSVWRVPREFF